ncbi:hypothetical protein pdam_00021384 [Pocillopora damicornis]|uniref:Uncharacterized protein n=1 Tax=Pocillopora damicornis TaxID=46731 RepID=A0A3M6UL28_POCDA|nr:hypothetical protein pdam_00021384 [Pocillopora damicornis]
MRTEYKFSSLSISETRYTATSQSSSRCCQMVMLNEILEIDCGSNFLCLICMTFSMHFRSMKIARGAAPATRKCLNISVQHVNTSRRLTRILSIARSVGSAESIATDPSTVMFVTYAWTNVLKENISADLIRDTMNAAFVWRMPSVAVKFYPALTRFTKTVQLQ